MNPKFRPIYLLLGFSGLLYLMYYAVSSFSDGINPATVLAISLPDLVFFFLAYKTYPAKGHHHSKRGHHRHKRHKSESLAV